MRRRSITIACGAAFGLVLLCVQLYCNVTLIQNWISSTSLRGSNNHNVSAATSDTTPRGSHNHDASAATSDTTPRWFDSIHVNHESDVLLMRFTEYDDFVDEFHVFESNVSHQGQPKPMRFHEKRDLFSEFAHKIFYHTITPLPINSSTHPDAFESHDRQFVGNFMQGLLQADDVLIFSDADEVIAYETLKRLKAGVVSLPVRVHLPIYKYSFRWLQTKNSDLYATVLSGEQAHEILDFQSFRYSNRQGIAGPILPVIRNGGWQPSTFGTLEQIDTKSRSNIIEGHDRIHAMEELERRVHNGISLWDENVHFTYQPNPPSPLPRLAVRRPLTFETSLMRYERAPSSD